jgi:hypothetical protein
VIEEDAFDLKQGQNTDDLLSVWYERGQVVTFMAESVFDHPLPGSRMKDGALRM